MHVRTGSWSEHITLRLIGNNRSCSLHHLLLAKKVRSSFDIAPNWQKHNVWTLGPDQPISNYRGWRLPNLSVVPPSGALLISGLYGEPSRYETPVSNTELMRILSNEVIQQKTKSFLTCLCGQFEKTKTRAIRLEMQITCNIFITDPLNDRC